MAGSRIRGSAPFRDLPMDWSDVRPGDINRTNTDMVLNDDFSETFLLFFFYVFNHHGLNSTEFMPLVRRN